MSGATLSLLISLGVIGTLWIVLCYKKIIPDPIAKWTLAIAGGLVTLGLYPLLRALLEKKQPPVVIPPFEEEGPTKREVTTANKDAGKTDDRLEEIDKEADSISDDGFDDKLGGDFAKRFNSANTPDE